ncbi:unnamed protein product [Fraxinus pennsylvanica]|uniref:DELLA protein n=1 Tax=Fraxinus pennsylvanica TaxID=56036 RepID=A0AAD1Z239_9LAMI|nr:unnamed protein product [Fraxinus pennsylvanica]
MLNGGFEVDVMQPNGQMIENRCANLERSELSQWVEHVTKQLIEDLPEDETDEVVCDHGGASTLLRELGSKSIGRKNSGVYDDELGGESALIRSETKTDEQGLNLLTLLLECAVAISVDNLGEAQRMVLELTQTASPYSPSCAERVVAYFAKAMASRVINSWIGVCSPLIDYKSVHKSFQIFNNVSPFIKFAHFTSNQAILEAFHRQDKVHIIDLDIMQGLQWPALFHILATRIEGPPQVRMTGMGSSMELLVETGKQLSNFAKRLGMYFEFHPVAKKFAL